MSQFIDPIHFQDLSAKDPADVCCRAVCRYDRAARSYTLSVWDEKIVIFPHQQKIESASNGNDRYPLLHLFAIHYLLGSSKERVWINWTKALSKIKRKTDGGGNELFCPAYCLNEGYTHCNLGCKCCRERASGSMSVRGVNSLRIKLIAGSPIIKNVNRHTFEVPPFYQNVLCSHPVYLYCSIFHLSYSFDGFSCEQ